MSSKCLKDSKPGAEIHLHLTVDFDAVVRKASGFMDGENQSQNCWNLE